MRGMLFSPLCLEDRSTIRETWDPHCGLSVLDCREGVLVNSFFLPALQTPCTLSSPGRVISSSCNGFENNSSLSHHHQALYSLPLLCLTAFSVHSTWRRKPQNLFFIMIFPIFWLTTYISIKFFKWKIYLPIFSIFPTHPHPIICRFKDLFHLPISLENIGTSLWMQSIKPFLHHWRQQKGQVARLPNQINSTANTKLIACPN